MPIYEYTCLACHSDFELLLPANRRDESKRCPDCGEERLSRKISLMANPVIREGGKAAEFSCGMPNCCGGGCAID